MGKIVLRCVVLCFHDDMCLEYDYRSTPQTILSCHFRLTKPWCAHMQAPIYIPDGKNADAQVPTACKNINSPHYTIGLLSNTKRETPIAAPDALCTGSRLFPRTRVSLVVVYPPPFLPTFGMPSSLC